MPGHCVFSIVDQQSQMRRYVPQHHLSVCPNRSEPWWCVGPENSPHDAPIGRPLDRELPSCDEPRRCISAGRPCSQRNDMACRAAIGRSSPDEDAARGLTWDGRPELSPPRRFCLKISTCFVMASMHGSCTQYGCLAQLTCGDGYMVRGISYSVHSTILTSLRLMIQY